MSASPGAEIPEPAMTTLDNVLHLPFWTLEDSPIYKGPHVRRTIMRGALEYAQTELAALRRRAEEAEALIGRVVEAAIRGAAWPYGMGLWQEICALDQSTVARETRDRKETKDDRPA